jgi:hypothetical protein
MDKNLDQFMGDGTMAGPAEHIIRITMKGATYSKVAAGWAIFDPIMGMFRSYRDEWTRDVGQIRLYRTREMAELAAIQHVRDDE